MIVARDIERRLRKAARQFPALTLTGPRQSGKSTLCRAIFAKHPYASLEAPDVRAFALEDPRAFLSQFPKGAIIDEVQRAPDLPSYLQGVIDEDPKPGRWILTGLSRSPWLLTRSEREIPSWLRPQAAWFSSMPRFSALFSAGVSQPSAS